MKISVLLSMLLISVANFGAQTDSNRLLVKFGDGTQYDMNVAGAIIREDSTLAIFGTQKGSISHTFQISLTPTDKNGPKKFKTGKYYFAYMDQAFNFVPGETMNFEARGYYIEKNNETLSQEWMTGDSPEKGVIEIENITPNRIKGRFFCELIQNFPIKGVKKTAEGTFDVAFISKTKSTNSTSNVTSNTSKTSNTEPTTKKLKITKNEPLLGLYDVQFALGAITSGDMGLDADLGATLINVAYGNDASATVELHYAYSGQNFSSTMSDRRNHVYTRIRPFCSTPLEETNANNLIGLFISGLYADVGYSTGHYYYSDYMGNRLTPDYSNNGMFWGWGWNLIWRSESRWGASVGFGSKRFIIQLPNGTQSKYKSPLISVGVVYNILWRN